MSAKALNQINGMSILFRWLMVMMLANGVLIYKFLLTFVNHVK